VIFRDNIVGAASGDFIPIIAALSLNQLNDFLINFIRFMSLYQCHRIMLNDASPRLKFYIREIYFFDSKITIYPV